MQLLGSVFQFSSQIQVERSLHLGFVGYDHFDPSASQIFPRSPPHAMTDQSRDSLSLRWAGWPAAFLILGAAVAVELLPIIGGSGEAARFDWAWIYVTVHFILLPLACVVHIATNLYRILRLFRSQTNVAVHAGLSLTIPIGYLVLLCLSPVFPMSTELILKALKSLISVSLRLSCEPHESKIS